MPVLKSSVYLAGGIENEKNLGAGWRAEIGPKLEELGYNVLNPCDFEPFQLKGLHTARLPESVTLVNGNSIQPKHWHHLKYADRSSSSYRRFKKYMERIILYDLRVIEHDANLVVCYWNKATAKGAGTHGELTYAKKLGLPVYVVADKSVDLPGWIHGCATEIFTSFEPVLEILGE